MKENKKSFKSMRTAAGLMVMTLLTSCLVGGTFAKYTTEKPNMSNARIARFGVTIEAENDTAFAGSYENEGVKTVQSIQTTDGRGDMIFAPGTSGVMKPITISGRPEVSIEVKYTGQFSVANWFVPVDKEHKKWIFYCPVTITVGETVISGTKYVSEVNAENSFEEAKKMKKDFEDAVNAAIEACSASYLVKDFTGKDLSGIKIKVPHISWAWAFEGNDKYDTLLADPTIEKPAVEPEQGGNKTDVGITLCFLTTISQID